MHNGALIAPDNDILLLNTSTALAGRPETGDYSKDLNCFAAELRVEFRRAAQNIQSLVAIRSIITAQLLARCHSTICF